jgi:hypothetical protein
MGSAVFVQMHDRGSSFVTSKTIVAAPSRG